MAIDTCIENFSGAILKALAASTPNCRSRADPRPPIPAGTQDEICLKNRLRRRWQVTREPPLRAEVSRLQRSATCQLNEWRNDQWGATLESLDTEDQSLCTMTKRVMRVPTPSPPWSPRGNRFFRSWESRSPRWQSGDSVSFCDRSFGADSYWDSWRGAEVLLPDPCQRTQVNQPWRGPGSYQGSQGQQGAGPNGIPNRALKHLPQRAVSLLVQIFNAVLLTHFPSVWKHARVISTLKLGKDPAH